MYIVIRNLESINRLLQDLQSFYHYIVSALEFSKFFTHPRVSKR